MTIDNVRIREHDNYNLVIERYEEKPNAKNDDKEEWKFKGYTSTVKSGLKSIMIKDLLNDKNSVSDLKTHIEQMQESEQKILDAIAD